VSSLRVEGVRFSAYPNDHAPPHVHGKYGSGVIVVEIFEDMTVALSPRKRAIIPSNMKKGDINKILQVAGRHIHELWELWEARDGKSSKNDER
jgi:hypothetical protein